MGQRNGFSANDVAKLNAMYACDKTSIGAGATTPTAKPTAKPTAGAKPAAASSAKPKPKPTPAPSPSPSPVLTFLGNLIRPFFHEDGEEDLAGLDAVDADIDNSID